MPGPVLEVMHRDNVDVDLEIIPGVTALCACSARLGAPIMNDFAVISLSDLLLPWKTIRARLEAVAAADLVVALYNPRSMRRVRQLEEAVEILRKHRPGTTPVGIATALGTDAEHVWVTDLDHLLEQDVPIAKRIGMRTVVIVGNTTSRRLGAWFVTPRGYVL